MPRQRRPPTHLTPPELPESPDRPEPPESPGSPAEGTSGALVSDSAAESPLAPLRPCHSPGTGHPFPDLMALRLARVPDPSPPFDDEISPGSPPGTDETWSFAVSGTAGPAGPAARSGPTLQSGATPQSGPTPQSESATQSGPAAQSSSATQSRSAGRSEPAGHAPPERAQGVQVGGHRPDGSRAQPIKRPPGSATGPEPGAWPSQFAQVLAETLAGSRPASQIVPWTTERARAHIRRLGPLLAVQQRPRVQRVVTSCPAEGVVEFAAIVGFGSRTRALAGRLERASPRPATPGRPSREARWLCTAVESG